jgi:hypothetical protein
MIRARSQPTLEPMPPQVHNPDIPQPWAEVQRNEEFDSEQAPSGRTTPSRPVDYRLVLMSDLEKLRNVIGRREDIDKEWCRLMVERLRGTGLDF